MLEPVLSSESLSVWQLGAREDCWPIENVHKVVVISGQFNGLTIPQLWATCYTYFVITLLFDLLGGFVKDNIVVRLVAAIWPCAAALTFTARTLQEETTLCRTV